MKFVKDYYEFRTRTMPVRDEFDLEIKPDFPVGIFLPDRIDELKQYCINHPEYHIMSVLKSAVEVNAPVAGAHFYYLATGDANPDIFYTNPVTQEQSEYSKIIEFESSH
ncbi:MAG: hypothetical protein NT027_14530 [Proteobacteria bacterium]|nr:hypothetical protein [Pseudomonadota bacterium]